MEEMINANTKVVGVIGYPLGHTLSPQMHNAAFREAGLNFVYLAWEVPPENLEKAIEGVRGLGIVGLNVTIPHKEKVLRLMDDVSEEAEFVGAVNTIHNLGGKLIGYNTDIIGFLKALGKDVRGKTAVVMGAGGAGKAVAYALAKNGARCIILNRTEEKAKALAERLSSIGEVTSNKLSPSVLESLKGEMDILINATSVGMKGEEIEGVGEVLSPKLLVMDLVYNPPLTPLLGKAKAVGAEVVEGWRMLLHQGAASWEIWTGKRAPVGVMEEVLLKNLYGL